MPSPVPEHQQGRGGRAPLLRRCNRPQALARLCCCLNSILPHLSSPSAVDFHPNGQLVTGGADKEVKVWEVERGEDGYAAVKHLSSLTAHLSTVNCVRFSPTGACLHACLAAAHDILPP
jgi:WD40 repeat protein